MWETIRTILILIVMLGILLASHELGHLLTAKAFNVYCMEYAIGFGPRLFSIKPKRSETRFSLRLLPLGGFVSMFNRETEIDDAGTTVPDSRSLDGIKPWKKAIVMSAGVFVNFFLAFFFCMVFSLAFPASYQVMSFDTTLNEQGVSATYPEGEGGTSAYAFWIKGNINDYAVDVEKDRLYSPMAATRIAGEEGAYHIEEYGYLIDTEASINGTTYVATYYWDNIVRDHDLFGSLNFYLPKEGYHLSPLHTALGVTNYPDDTLRYNPKEGDILTLHLTLLKVEGKESRPSKEAFDSRIVQTITTKRTTSGWDVSSLKTTRWDYYAPFGQRLKNGCSNFAYFFEAIGQGLKQIFTFHFTNLSSIVGMGSILRTETIYAGVGRTFFLYGGYISLNLAIINLLPFPGLDGWQLLVTGIEAGTKKRIPDKVKSIMSYVGLGLLLAFSIFIIVKDIIALVV